MNRIRPYLPLLLALSTSSPFFNGRFTGLQSYRASVFASLPRTGIPPYFSSWDEYRTTVDHLLTTGLLTDPSFIWWDARPSARFPTLEVRIHDMPSRVEETICLAAWVQALAVKLAREPEPAQVRRFITDINKWEAARHGLDAQLLLSPDGPRQRLIDWVEALLEWLADVAKELDSEDALAYTRIILQEGTSSTRQLRVWRETNDLQEVVAQLAQETLGP
jgi:carboxylate-amine ligase